MIPIALALILFGLMAYYGIRQVRHEKQKKKRRLALADAYYRLISQHRIVVDHYEIIGNRFVVLDRKNKKLIVIDHNETGKQEMCISLLAVSETRIIEEKNPNGHVGKIFLQ